MTTERDESATYNVTSRAGNHRMACEEGQEVAAAQAGRETWNRGSKGCGGKLRRDRSKRG